MPSSFKEKVKKRKKLLITIIVAVPPLIIAALWISFDRGPTATICSILLNVVTILVAIFQWHWPQLPHTNGKIPPVETVPFPLPAPDVLPPSSPNSKPPFDEALLPRPPHLVGRNEDLDWLLKRLRNGRTTVLSALRGMGGIGKTALAAEAIHQIRLEQRFPDGIAVVNCQQITNAQQIVLQVLARFDLQYSQGQHQSQINVIEAAQFTLTGKMVLIVLDNLEPEVDLEEVLTPFQTAGATVLLTARHTLPPTIVPAEACRKLDLLSLEAAIDLFAQSVGRSGADDLTPQEYQAVERIVQRIERHTLAVKIFGSYAADCGRDLPALAKELQNPQHILRIASGEMPQGMLHVFFYSIRTLPEQLRYFFAALAAFSSTQFGRQAARMLATTLHVSEPDTCIDWLIRRALLDTLHINELFIEGDYERLRLHPLLRIWAQEFFDAWTETEREQAWRAVASYYATYIADISDRELAADDENIAGALEWTESQQEKRLMVQLCIGMHHFWYIRGRSAISLHYLPLALLAAEELAIQTQDIQDYLWAAQLTLAYGQILERTGKPEEAEQMFQKNLVQCQKLSDRHGEGKALQALGKLAQARRGLPEAEPHYQRALLIACELQDKQGEAEVLRSLGEVAQVGGRLEEGEDFYRRALAIVRELHHQREEGEVLRSLGELLWWRGNSEEVTLYFDQALAIALTEHNLQEEGWLRAALGGLALRSGRLQNAEEYFLEALKIDREVQDRHEEAWTLFSLGKLSKAQGKPEKAAQFYQQALTIYEKTEDRRETTEVICSLAEIALWQGLPEKAEQKLLEALRIDQQLLNRRGEGLDWRYKGQYALAQGDLALAEHCLSQALTIDRSVQDVREIAEVLATLGTVAFYCERLKEAEQIFQQALNLHESTHNDYGQGEIYQLLGELAVRRRQMKKAQQYLSRARIFAQKLQDRKTEGATLRVLGEVAILEGQLKKAEEFLQQSCAITREIGLRREEGRTLIALGMLAQQYKQTERAESYYHQAWLILDKIQDRFWMAFLSLRYVQVLSENTAVPSRGCQMLVQTQQYYHEQQLPYEQYVRKIARKVGCQVDLL